MGTARIDSAEALKGLRGALSRFGDTVRGALDEAEAHIRQVQRWLEQDQYRYWKQQVVRREEAALHAQLELQRKQYSQKMFDGHSSFVEERRALKIARQRVEEAITKLDRVKHWMRVLEREALLYKGAVQGAASSVDLDVPTALTRLDNMVRALEAYTDARVMWDAPPSHDRPEDPA